MVCRLIPTVKLHYIRESYDTVSEYLGTYQVPWPLPGLHNESKFSGPCYPTAFAEFDLRIAAYLAILTPSFFFKIPPSCSSFHQQGRPQSLNNTYRQIYLQMAAEPFTLDEYGCVDPPKRLWRVTHGNSQSQLDHDGNHLAADDSRVFHDEVELKEAVQHHIDWWSSRPSCFLSVFSDENHAANWAAQREKRDPPAYIHEIDTTLLFGVQVLDMELLMDKLEIEHPYSAHELLFLNYIPAHCIVHTRTVSGTQQHHTRYLAGGWSQALVELGMHIVLRRSTVY